MHTKIVMQKVEFRQRCFAGLGVFVMQVASRESKREDDGKEHNKQKRFRVMAVIVVVYVVIDIAIVLVVHMRLCSCAHEAARQRQAKTGAEEKRSKNKEE